MYINIFGLVIDNTDRFSNEYKHKHLVYVNNKDMYNIHQEIREKHKQKGWTVDIEHICSTIELNISKFIKEKFYKEYIEKVDKQTNKKVKQTVTQLKLDL